MSAGGLTGKSKGESQKTYRQRPKKRHGLFESQPALPGKVK